MRSSKKPNARQLTSTLMAIVMTATTTFQMPNIALASEAESSVAVESQIEEVTTKEASSVEVQSETVTQAAAETQTGTALETSSAAAGTDATQVSDEVQTTVAETTAEVTYEEEKTTLSAEVDPSGEDTEESEANETRGPDEELTTEIETEIETEAQTDAASEEETEASTEEALIDLSTVTKDEILAYIEAIGGTESDAYYEFLSGLGEDDYQLVWIAQFGSEEDVIASTFDFDYDASSDLEIAKYVHKLTEDELYSLIESMTFEQYRRYLSIKEMMAEMDEKDFSDVIDEEEFTADRTWDYESYDAFAESLTGVSLQRTEQTMQFYNTYVDPSKVQAGVTTIDGLLDSNADWYSNDYILSLNPEMFKETVPVYRGSDGNYYVVSTVPTLNGVESADYQPATSFYNGGVEAQAFTDIEYLGNGVYRIPSSRYQYCFTEQYVSDMGTLYGISFGLRIQVLYGFTPSGEITIAADVVYPDMTERFLPATLNLLAGTATVRVFNDDYDDSVDKYLVSASINRGAGLPDSVGSMNDGKVLQFVVNDANAVGSLDVLIGYNATSKYSMAAEVTTSELIGSASDDANVNMAAEMYNGAYLKLDQGSVPKNLAVGDKFIYANTALTITGVTTAYDGRGGMHIGATEVPTHDAQSFCLYNGLGVEPQISSWFKTQLNTNSADPGYMVQMTAANISKRASYNGTSVNLGGNKIFGYRTDGLGVVSGTDGKVLNLEGTNVLLSCMHAWGNESASTPQDIVDAISAFTGRTQKDFAIDEGFGHYHPNVALQCTDVHDGGDGNMYATFKVVTSMLQVGGVVHPQNYQCAFATISIVYPSAPKTGFLQIHKSSADPAITNGSSCYNFEGIPYGIFTDAECRNPVTVVKLDANGYSQPYELPAGTYYVREAEAKPGSGYETNSTVYTKNVTAGTTADAPVMCETTDVPLNDPLGIVINKINSDGTTSADLSGAEYTITYYPRQYNTLAEIQADPEAKPTQWIIKTVRTSYGTYEARLDDDHIVSGEAKFGRNTQGTYIIPLGTITVQETKAPVGFTVEGATVSSMKTGATLSGTNGVYLFNIVDENSAVYLKSGNAISNKLDDETAVTLTYAERQINGSPKMEKHDFELNKKAAMGGTNFEGISFEIYCLDDSVAIGNDIYAKGQTITTVTADAEGNIDVGMQFPVGHYAVREKAANNYYTMTTGQIHYFNVVEYQGGAFIQYEPDTNAVTFMDRVVRGDLSFVKKNSDTDEALAYIPFRITNNTTGETHYILTGADGTYTSAAGKTTNTNANDAVLSQYGDKDVIPQSVVDSLAKDAGLWFGMGSEGTMTAANDSYGSFVYGTYTITELKTEATRSMKMYTNTFTIDTDGKVLDLGTVNNVPMGIKTTLVDVNGEHFTEPVPSITLTDHVAYKNLDTDKKYTLKGTLYIKEGDALTELMTETVDFTPAEKNGTQDVTFTFDASGLVGKSVVAFEELSVNGEFCAEHKDKDDENQTVTFPGIQTTARDNVTEDHVSNATDSITIVDTVVYTGLKKGDTYTVTGTLMDAETGEAALDDDGNAITASKEFTAPTADGNIDITFTFAGVSLAGKTLVAFEQIDHDGKKYAVHADINDKSQTVYIPKIRTKAVDANTGLNQVKADSNVTVVDTVTYTHLLPGKTYVMKGVLMTSAGNALMVNGKTITAGTEFVPTTPDGTVDVTFNFDASEIGGRKLVFYEYLELDGNTVASHTDISDTDQTVYVPKIRTTIFDSENGSHNSAADKDITLIDTVRYNGVEIGRRYTVVGTLVDKETGNALLDDAGNKITASNEFVAEKTNGTIDVTFKFSGVCLAGKTTVAFEEMYSEGKKVAVHADLRDEKQTEYFPSVHTTATSNDTKDHVVGANEKVTITDNVALKALKLGTEYTLSGILMNAETGKEIVIDGKTITARKTFTADAHEMTIPLTYELNASELAGTTTVVFENLYSDGALLASHADVTDAEQTVYIPEIHTTAKDAVTDINHTEAKKEATIVDTVFYTDLLPGREYTVSGTLVNKATGAPIMIGDEVVCASTTFTPSASTGSVDVLFTFDASAIEGTTVVAFESMTYKGIEVAVHADVTDEDQTVYIPKVRTTAISGDTKDHVTEAKKDVTIVDTVSYEGLEVGREYAVKGVLMNKATGKAITVNGKEVTAEAAFTAEAAKGSIDLTFTFDGSALEDTLLVVFETLYTEDKEVGVHADINDDAQTVYLPKIHTNAKDAITEINHTEAKPQAKIIDTVSYSSLLPGKEYTVTGTLMNKTTGEPVLIGDKPITASTTFTAEKSSGSVQVVFEFDASVLEGITVVAYESMTYKGIEVAVHADITDEDQTVYIPKIRTTAIGADTKDHVTEAKKDVTIVDTVSYEGLEVGREYTVKGVLMNKATGKAITVNGKEVTAETTFTAEAAEGTVDVTFTFDGSGLEDTLLVAFEKLYTQEKEVGVHADIDDDAQTVYLPKIRTNAKDAITEINHTEAKPQAKVIDTVTYSSLLPGKEYTVTGTLMNKATGNPVLIGDKPITASTTFTAERSSGSVQIVFEFDASVLEGITVVAYESMTYKGIEVAVHADITDKDQTVYIPKVRTTAIGDDTKDHVTEAKKDVTIVDTVSYEGLEVGREYTVKGVLMNKATGKAITVNGKEVTAETTFTAEAAKGSIDLTFTFDGSALEDTLLVAFETLYTQEKEVGVHADINDAAQTVYLPKIRTNAKDAITEINHTEAKPQAKVIDTVTYSSLLPGKEYTVTGTLMNKATGNPVLIGDKPITASTTFTAERSSGSVQIVFEFDASVLEGVTVVAYESMTYKGIEVAVHADITDKDQTVYIPKIRTTAISGDTKDHVTEAKKDVTIVDTVSYEGLEVGREYTVKGVLMNKATGKAITVNDKEVTAETTFTAEAAEGTVDVTFTFDGSGLEDTLLVAFEKLYTQEQEVGVHADINDAAQTVYLPKIRTNAKDAITEINHTEAKPQATIIDTVTYSSLLPGKEYTVTGTLMNKTTGEPVLIDGEPITAETTFTAEKSSGSVPVVFEFDASVLEGVTVVAYESMTYKGIEVAVHADITDKDQTVYIPKVRTTAIGDDTKDHVTEAKKDVTIVDTVSYEGLEVGREYTVTGILMDKKTQEAILADGKEVTAETTFTAEAAEGTVDVTFTFDGSGLEDTLLVAFEKLYTQEQEVGVHADIDDDAQTVYLPKIRTNAKDAITEINHTEAKPQAKVIDTVTYSSLLPGKEYTVTGTLMNKATGELILADGKEITASTTFTAERSSGSVQVVFEFDASVLEGITVVAYESMTYKGIEVAVHADITDKDQTDYIPKVRTTAISGDTKDHVTEAKKDVTIVDTVSYEGLEVGREYTVKGVLMNKATGKAITVNDKEVTAETTFTAEAAEGTVDVTFAFDGSALEDTLIVVFETLYTQEKEVGVHADINDAAQTVYLPKIRTNAKDAITEINHTEAKPQAKVIDTVTYSSLLPGKEYTVTGTLMNKATGEPVLIDGEPITAETTFTAEKSSGSVPVVFKFDASVLEGITVVAYESMTYKGIEVAVHADITDKDQTVYIPKIRTTAIGDDTKDHVTEAKKDVTIVDTVSYEGLEVGREYTVTGILMDKKTQEAILADGKEVTAETTFTAEAAEGTVDVTFTFDGSGLEDTLLVAFEKLYTQKQEVGVHADIDDDAQTVYLPKIRTNAKDAVTEIDHTEALPMATIIDTVTYSSLLPGKEYTVTGTLMNKATGEPVMIGDEPVCASTTFIAETAEGSVEIVFEFDASAIAGTTVVAFESMEYEGVEVAVHADIEDEDQTVYIPDVHTTATASDTQDHVTGANETVTITDEVALTGLKIGNEYTVKGVLMDKTTGKELTVNGESIVAETVFTADEADMTVSLTYTLDASALAGTTTVVFETLYTEGKEVGRHHEIEDEGQTVYIPEIHTTAADKETEINHTEATKKAVIVDTVLYSHLLAGKEYTVKGQLINKATGEPILIDGEPITAQTTFTAEKEEGSVDVIFEFDASAIAPTTIVAFESLEYKEIEIAVHADIEDEDQTVYVPDIHTTALAQDTEDHIEKAKEDVTIVDTVAYEGLEIGREYTVKGILMDKESGEAILVDGEEVTAEETFIAEAQEGSIDITFTFDASALAGKSVVAFETLYTEEKEVAVHADIEDEGQTVRIPEIKTTATDKVTGDHDGVVAKETTVLDEVFYKNLIPGKEYTVHGKLMVKETGEPLTVNGKEVTAEKTFVAEEADGSIILEFTFDSSALAGKHIVAFEDVEYKGISIGTHADLEDEDQTISYPEIHTSAVDQASGSKTMVLGTGVTLVDTVSYKGLTAGKTYVVKGTVVDKASGESIGVTAETTFVAEAADGQTTVTFTFDTSRLEGKTLVVFETLYDEQGNQLVDHKDLNDADQTVTVPVKPQNPPVVTGDDSTPMPYVLALSAALLAVLAVVAVLVKRRKKQA